MGREIIDSEFGDEIIVEDEVKKEDEVRKNKKIVFPPDSCLS